MFEFEFKKIYKNSVIFLNTFFFFEIILEINYLKMKGEKKVL
jgi:hypothetical protein